MIQLSSGDFKYRDFGIIHVTLDFQGCPTTIVLRHSRGQCLPTQYFGATVLYDYGTRELQIVLGLVFKNLKSSVEEVIRRDDPVPHVASRQHCPLSGQESPTSLVYTRIH